jgi:hypothetical protein
MDLGKHQTPTDFSPPMTTFEEKPWRKLASVQELRECIYL